MTFAFERESGKVATGYCGRVLHVDLTEEKIWVEEPPEEFYRTYFGGRSLIAYYLLREVPAGADPFGPDNVLVWSSGVLSGAPVAGAGRGSVGSKSPLTGGFASSEAGGFWHAELKRAGFDAVVVKGMARKPTYLLVCDGRAELRDASRLWQLHPHECAEEIWTELGDKRARICQIGLGAVNLARYGCVSFDLNHFAGRGGIGSVMGSKRLKAVVVRGHRNVPLADVALIKREAEWLGRNWQELVFGLYDLGTAGTVLSLNRAGGLPTKNFNYGHFEEAEKISGQVLRDRLLVGRESCMACPIKCKRVVDLPGGGLNRAYGGPEYETIASLGSLCGVSDLEAICRANELCNMYTLDTISTGVCIAFAMECYEHGLISKAEADGLELNFGNTEVVLKLIEMIALRRGLGGVLADGVMRAADVIGSGAESFAMHVKGQEIPMHEPRLKYGLGLGYAMSPTGADHCHNVHDTAFQAAGKGLDDVKPLGILKPMPADYLGPEKVRLLYYFSTWRHFLDSAVLCLFVPWGFDQILRILEGVTGWKSTVWELMKVGERAAIMARAFIAREGFKPGDDALPDRFFTPFPSGPLAGKALDRRTFETAKQLYREMAGLDSEGNPAASKVMELGLDWLRSYG